MIKIVQRVLGLLMLAYTSMVCAALDIEIIGAGEHQIPVSVVPMGGDEKLGQAINEVVVSDLQRTGLFRLVDTTGKSPHDMSEVNYTDWQLRGAVALAIGTVNTQPNGRIEARFRLLDVVKKQQLVGQAVSGSDGQAPRGRAPNR